MNSKVILTLYGEGEFSSLHAEVMIEDDIPVVEFRKSGQLIATRAFPDNTLQYAEDAAENYILGILRL